MTARSFHGLPEMIQSAGTRVEAALAEPDPSTRASLLLTAEHDMDRLAATVHAAADAADLQSRRPLHGRSA